ncbi:MAG: dTDP-4-dehydrorhamnose 3,5-epimerase [Pseudomonadaceae bacterium]|nr:dTDP-4-dehydrorhamnose 3,5-epimerase [Pseudomonadaceae bacterium]
MKAIQTELPGVLIIEPDVFGDERGFFLETYQQSRYQDIGIEFDFVQDNHSRSQRGVLRGLHAQKNNPQGKLVRVSQGAVFDVAADINPASDTFGKWVGVELNDNNMRQLWIPPGYAHGFQVLSETADFEYKCTAYYDPQDEIGVRWDDPTLNVQWPLKQPTVSAKDKQLPTLEMLRQ